MLYTPVVIAGIVGGRMLCPAEGYDHVLSELVYDSRKMSTPTAALFIALRSTDEHAHPSRDGHRFVADAHAKGVRVFLVENPAAAELFARFPDAYFIATDDTLAALQTLATHHRAQFPALDVIGITGSNGKTMVKEWLYQLLHDERRIVRSPKSFNSQIGVPLSVWQIQDTDELGIFEAGISERGEMERLAAIIAPTVGIFTNIGEAHSAGFTNYAEKATEKMRLFAHAQTIIYNPDFREIAAAATAYPQLAHYTWAIVPHHPDTVTDDAVLLYAHPNVRLLVTRLETVALAVATDAHNAATAHTRITAYHRPETNAAATRYEIEIPFTDRPSIENAVQCWATMLLYGYSHGIIRERMLHLEGIGLRMELKGGINGCLIIDDSYSLEVRSLMMSLDFLAAQHTRARATAILSDVLQTRLEPAPLYARIAHLLVQHGIERVVAIGDNIAHLKKYLPEGIEQHYFHTTEAFLAARRTGIISFYDETILLKGARAFAFERIAATLVEQQHCTTLEINLTALAHNFHVFRRFLRPATQMMAMVKAAGYGVGSVRVAKVLESVRANYLAVAYTDEGVTLRRARIRLPIMVMNAPPDTFETLFEHHLEPELYSRETLTAFANFVRRKTATDPNHPTSPSLIDAARYPVHIKLDTGMHRLGFELHDIAWLAEFLTEHPEIRVVSILSHLAASSSDTHRNFTFAQKQAFDRMVAALRPALSESPLLHLLNSAGIHRYPEAEYDMVRLGIGLYGCDDDPRIQTQLRTVATLTTTVLQTKIVSAGETIGYNRAGLATAATRIATIGIGYADGFSRRLGNGQFSVLVGGRLAPTVGNVCMDMTMIDITDIEGIETGDTVEIFGDGLPVAAFAAALGSIPYEAFTAISERVRRVYFEE